MFSIPHKSSLIEEHDTVLNNIPFTLSISPVFGIIGIFTAEQEYIT